MKYAIIAATLIAAAPAAAEPFPDAIRHCWNMGPLSDAARQTAVTVQFDLSADGRPEPDTIRPLDFSGGPIVAAEQAFEAAKRAIIRCSGPAGYDASGTVTLLFTPHMGGMISEVQPELTAAVASPIRTIIG